MDFIETPYDQYKTSLFWRVIEKNLKLLKDNQDIQISTHPDYVIGLLTKPVEETLKKQNK